MGYYFLFNATHPAVLNKNTKKLSFSVNTTLLILILILISHINKTIYFTQAASSSCHPVLQYVKVT